MKSSMTQASHRGMIIKYARFSHYKPCVRRRSAVTKKNGEGDY
ncbi:hypothetical protein [Algoriphagus persicinus]|nr:hypothetical protein [Algoriphagus sp. E1-3-M2]MEB2787177.1 hypothetical protein [Algoriphagus sp. E1-3-M2]